MTDKEKRRERHAITMHPVLVGRFATCSHMRPVLVGRFATCWSPGAYAEPSERHHHGDRDRSPELYRSGPERQPEDQLGIASAEFVRAGCPRGAEQRARQY